MTSLIAEICIDSVEGAIAAGEAGADRVELCANLLEGGTTPSVGLMETTIAHGKLPVQVMIRPRGGDFLYSDLEIEITLPRGTFISTSSVRPGCASSVTRSTSSAARARSEEHTSELQSH